MAILIMVFWHSAQSYCRITLPSCYKLQVTWFRSDSSACTLKSCSNLKVLSILVKAVQIIKSTRIWQCSMSGCLHLTVIVSHKEILPHMDSTSCISIRMKIYSGENLSFDNIMVTAVAHFHVHSLDKWIPNSIVFY